MESWLRAVTSLWYAPDGSLPAGLVFAQSWQRFERYELAKGKGSGLVLRGRGGLVEVDLQVDLAHELSRYGGPSIPQGRVGLERLANRWGLTGEWTISHDLPRSYSLSPPAEQSIDEFDQHIREVRDTYRAYEAMSQAIGQPGSWVADLRRADELFRVNTRPVVRSLLGKLYWEPAVMQFVPEAPSAANAGRTRPWAGFSLLVPPTLHELAMAGIISAFLESDPVRSCRICELPYQSPRPNSIYCSKTCRQKASRLGIAADPRRSPREER